MTISNSIRRGAVLAALALDLAMAVPSRAERLLGVDATQAAPAPGTAYLKMGSAASASGHTLAINSQYLVLDGKPWLPVMGEFHFERSPAASWDAELRKMKAAGVDVVSTYVMWNYHEQQPGHFDWGGDNDLRRFVQLAGKAGLKVFLRVGPWVHAEARFGGLPDWVVNTMPVRRNDPEYLRAAERWYQQIGAQVKGLLWKDDGPVIGLQIENEYSAAGPGQGAAHMAALKRLALDAGFDLPLYTAFSGASYAYPPGEFTPTYGGYADSPWDSATKALAPKGSFAFHFDNRSNGDIGQQEGLLGGGATPASRDAVEKALTPFLGAEFGTGLPQMYRRRMPVTPEDILSLLTVQLGSGANQMGYYMFHGGRNRRPEPGGGSLEESTLSGGVNDTPQVNYDFQGPLGPDGQPRDLLRRIRAFNLFVNAFGERLAPMTVRKPDLLPANSADLGTPRYALRARGDSAFLFVNNHTYQAPMADFDGVRFGLRLPGQALQLPSQPITLRPGESFIWPVNFDLDGTRLRYASAQPVTRLDAGADGIVYVFSQSAAHTAEFAFDAADQPFIRAPQAQAAAVDGLLVLRADHAGLAPLLRIERPGARPVQVLLLSEAQSGALSVLDFAGRKRLLISDNEVWTGPDGLHLRSTDHARFRFAVYPALARSPRSTVALGAEDGDGLFQKFALHGPEIEAGVLARPLRAALPAPVVKTGGQAGGALQPPPEAWGAAAAWKLELHAPPLQGDLDDLLLETDFAGDIGRLFAGSQLVDDWYYFGQPWQLGLKGLPAELRRQPLQLSVLPLRADAPIYLPPGVRPDFAGQAQLAAVRSVRLRPVYQAVVRP